MQRLESHIENLLLTHECVIIPGVGGFVTRYEAPFFSDDKTEIFPPYRSVSFNSQLRENDGLLTQSYMAAYDTNYPKALSLVEKDVRALIEKINTEGGCHIASIGTLQYTRSRALLFTPDSEAGFYSKELYGLNQCLLQKEMSASEEDKAILTTDTTHTDQDSPIKVVSTQHIDHSAPNSTMAKDPTHYIIRISKSAVRNTVATVAAAMLYFIFAIAPSGQPLVSPNVREAAIISTSKSESPKPQAMPDKTAAKPVAKASKQAKAPKTAAPKPNNTPAKPSNAPVKPNNVPAKPSNTPATPAVNAQRGTSAMPIGSVVKPGNYTLVLASEVTQKGANGLVAELNKAGFNGAKVVMDGKMIRVIYSSYADNHSAYSALKKLSQASKYFQSAWVLKQ